MTGKEEESDDDREIDAEFLGLAAALVREARRRGLGAYVLTVTAAGKTAADTNIALDQLPALLRLHADATGDEVNVEIVSPS